MSDVTIYHNPRCSKSRQALALLQAHGVEPRVVLYLDAPPTAAELERLLRLLDREPLEVVRRGERPFRELGLGEPGRTREELIAAMVAHPILIERPIVVSGDRAVLGRPPERVLDLL